MESIPKIIHYCWFGNEKMPKNIKKNISNWKTILKDFEVIEWNESNVNLEANSYIKQAYMYKKWAFVSDYVRLMVLYEHGGIYMDTDVEVLKSLNSFLNCKNFFSYETKESIATHIIGATQHNELIKFFLEYYKKASFIDKDMGINYTTNVVIITKMLQEKYKTNFDGTYQVIENNIHIYPVDYFCAKNFSTGIINITQNTHAIHHFSGSWNTKKTKIKKGNKKENGKF